ncbi:MAG: class I SAM-dependent methyltransferase [Ilumatobacter sp.]|uniref:class I SAM-dependent methyltransferase n=1 Tax=Ilumatobacter sp. TaxID=1967498 RepID=UPI00391D0AC9
MHDDATRWDARYDGHRLASPSRPDALTDELESVVPTSGRALDVAAGAGAQSLWLERRGLSVVALDVSPVAVGLVRDAADAAGLAAGIEVRVADLDDGLDPDLTRFDVIVCQRFRAPHLYAAFVERLVPGGIAVVTVLSQVGADQPGPFHAPAGELLQAFERDDVELLRHVEADGQASIVVRRR